MGFGHLLAYGNHDLWVKMYNLSRVFKTDISAVLTIKSGLDPHRLEFSKKMAHDDNGDDSDDDSGDDYNGGSYDNG
ncbi:hypothetical protein U9M48_028854 [Paspalum notatum var. saurae]|uniref:Uncharacterized protein n=1 Tax=Paspalum notatum var. saurae TaxID=547442 RepID=A0AAQ3TX88_PASNO